MGWWRASASARLAAAAGRGLSGCGCSLGCFCAGVAVRVGRPQGLLLCRAYTLCTSRGIPPPHDDACCADGVVLVHDRWKSCAPAALVGFAQKKKKNCSRGCVDGGRGKSLDADIYGRCFALWRHASLAPLQPTYMMQVKVVPVFGLRRYGVIGFMSSSCKIQLRVSTTPWEKGKKKKKLVVSWCRRSNEDCLCIYPGVDPGSPVDPDKIS